MLVILAIIMAPYFFQTQINENLPQFSQYMVPYVETIDQIRLWLNDIVQKAQAMIAEFTGGGGTQSDG